MDKLLQILAVVGHAYDVAGALWQAFANAVAPYLIAVAIPAAITGLTPVPKTAGVISFLRKVVAFLSVLTHHDQPGTFKVPALPEVWHALKSAWKGTTVTVALFAMLLAGCAKFYAWEAAHPTVARVLECGKDAVITAVETILPDVLAAMSGSSPDWKAVGALEAAHGADAVGCAVRAAVSQAEEASAPDGGASMTMQGLAKRVASNGHAYLKDRGLE